MTDNRKTLHLRISADLLKQLDHYAVEENLFRGEAVEMILRAWFRKEAVK